MAQASDRLGLDAESYQVLRLGQVPRSDHLQGDQPVEAQMAGLVDHTHAAMPENIEELIPGDFREICRPLGLARWVAGSFQTTRGNRVRAAIRNFGRGVSPQIQPGIGRGWFARLPAQEDGTIAGQLLEPFLTVDARLHVLHDR